MSVSALLGLHLSADPDPALAGLIDLRQVIAVDNDAACRKIGPGKNVHESFGGDVGIIQKSQLGVNDLRQIVGRRACRHADRDSLRSVDQEIRNADRQDQGLLLGLIKVGAEIRHVLVQIRQKGLFRDLLQARFRVAHGRRPVSLDIAEVSVAVDQGKSLFELLGHDDQGIVDRAVAVGMVFTHGIAYDTGALSIGPVRADPQLIHIVEGAPLYRLEAVAHVGQGTGNDDTHRVVDIGLLHELRILGADDLLPSAGRISARVIKNAVPVTAGSRGIFFLFTHSLFSVYLSKRGASPPGSDIQFRIRRMLIDEISARRNIRAH